LVGEWVDQFVSLVEDHDLPHIKKVLRVMTYNLIVMFGHVADPTLWSAFEATLKVKKSEIAKFFKAVRAIFDLNGNPLYGNTVASSLVGLRWVDKLKMMMCHPLFLSDGVRKGVVFFCPGVLHSDLKKVFVGLIHRDYGGLNYDYVGVYFSDDSCVSYTKEGEIIRGNVDISSCDSSHSVDLFLYIRKVLSGRGLDFHGIEMIDILLSQLMVPFKIPLRREINGKVRITDYLRFKPKTPRLYSGSVLTTLVNNFASMSILVNFFYDCPTKTVQESARSIGYDVTFVPCEDPSQLQFLKHSPVWGHSSGVWDYYPVLNLGPFVRMMWSKTNGDVPGSGDLEKRFHSFMVSVLHGMYPRVSCPLFPPITGPIDERWIDRYKVDPDAPLIHVTTNDMLHRYGHSSEDFLLLDAPLDPRKIPLLRDVLSMDY